jgi:hypothetical protein
MFGSRTRSRQRHAHEAHIRPIGARRLGAHVAASAVGCRLRAAPVWTRPGRAQRHRRFERVICCPPATAATPPGAELRVGSRGCRQESPGIPAITAVDTSR